MTYELKFTPSNPIPQGNLVLILNSHSPILVKKISPKIDITP